MKRKILLLVTILLVMLCIPVYAEENVGIKEFVSLDGVKESTTFSMGNSIESVANVDGINFIFGNNIFVSGENDYLFVAGNTVRLAKLSTKDAFVTGTAIVVSQSNIRDLYAAAQVVKITSEISRNVYVGCDELIIDSPVNGDVYVSADKITIGSNANISGTLKYPKNADISISKAATVNKTKTYKNKEATTKFSIKNFIIKFMISFLSITLIAFVLLFVKEKMFKNIEKMDKKFSSILKTILLGIAFIILIPLIVILLMCSTIGFSLSVIIILLYGILCYISGIPTAYYFGNLAFKGKIKNKYLLLALSLFIICILRKIPYVGIAVTIISLCFGLGLYTKLIKDSIKIKK